MQMVRRALRCRGLTGLFGLCSVSLGLTACPSGSCSLQLACFQMAHLAYSDNLHGLMAYSNPLGLAAYSAPLDDLTTYLFKRGIGPKEVRTCVLGS
ncbi:hypothetical protein VNO77_20158 [Canavalia gladiata]|uniref:Uncharacterized protein n=1 Tax=Canavalia gladiata TaxID=3824 RepID=A0AAN9LSY3_CANGL